MGSFKVMVTIDTHVILWDALKPELISKKAKKEIKIANELDGIIVCDISLQKITPEIAELSTNLPTEINSDPADKMIVATSIATKSPLITADKNLRRSDIVNTIW